MTNKFQFVWGVIVLPLLFLKPSSIGFAAEIEARWDHHFLTVSGDFPGGEIRINYLEAYCRAGSTDRDWRETTIPHTSRQLPSAEPGVILLEDRLADGVVVAHRIEVVKDGLRFSVTAHNPTERPSAVHWAQPCVRVDRFTGSDPAQARERQPPYIQRCFVAIDGQLVRLPTQPWAAEARYVPGQVYCPAGVPRDDVNPRPLSSQCLPTASAAVSQRMTNGFLEWSGSLTKRFFRASSPASTPTSASVVWRQVKRRQFGGGSTCWLVTSRRCWPPTSEIFLNQLLV